MDTEKYKALLTALDCGSLAAAAEKLGYTTSGISRMMASLEKETGIKLLIRSKSGVRATAGCRQILPDIRSFLAASENLKKKLASLHGQIAGTVRIGTAYSYYYDLLSGCIFEFEQENPAVNVEIIYGYSTFLAEELKKEKLDLCLISRREIPGQWVPIKKDEMLAVVSSSSPLAEKKSVPLSVFSARPYIFTHPGTDSDSARVFQKYNILPNIRYTTEDSLATLSMVKANLGITLNNKLNADVWESGGICTLPLRPREIIEIGIGVSKDANEAVSAFLRKLLDTLEIK